MRSIKERLRAVLAIKQKNDETWAAKQTQAPPRDRIERVEVHPTPGLTVASFRWLSPSGAVISWYTEEELRETRARLAADAELPLAPGVAEEIMREVVMIDEALGDADKKGGSQEND